MQYTCILHQKHFHAHCDVISDGYITDKVQNQGGGQYSFGSSVKNTEVHDKTTLNVITTIKLSDTDNLVVVGTDVNLLILLSKRSHHSNG